MTSETLNEKAWTLAQLLASAADGFRVNRHTVAGALVLDCGIAAPGGLETGLLVARICLADAAAVTLVPGHLGGLACPLVQVVTDSPLRACLAAQYAGWAVRVGKFFAMGSGPMRAAWGKEELFKHIPGREKPPVAVGVLESRKLPDDEVVRYLSDSLGLPPDKLALVVAPTASLAGTVQIVARSVETALHKLHELKFDLNQLVSGFGTAPLPPIAADDLQALGRTNDAILYGGRVVLWVRADDQLLAEIGPRVPSRASPDFGTPFVEIFQRYQGDFYKIDPLLFSPAEVVFCNLTSGRTHTFGGLAPDVLRRSFLGEAG